MKDCASCVMRRVSRRVVRAVFAAALIAGCGSAWAAYVPVEWIKADGKQWIYTGYQPTCTDRVEMKVKFSTVGASQCLYCSRGATTTKDTFTGFLIKDTKKIRFDRNASTSASSSMTVGTVDDYVLVADGNSLACTVNGQQAATMAGDTFTPGSVFSLFASHTQGTALSDTTASSSMDNWGSYTLYYFRIYDKDGKLVRQFIPARDDSVSSGTAQYGLYELVTQTFHPGLGSGSFTAGSDAGSYRWNADKQCVEYQVSARGTDGVTVSLNGETYAESVVTDWTELGTPVTVTVTAQAPQGCSVIWEGVPTGVAAVRSANSITLTLSEAATLKAVAHTCTTLYWRGGTDEYASKSANWADAEGNPAASAPLNGDAIVLDANSANKPMTWDLDVEPGSWTQSDYTGTVTFQNGVVTSGYTVYGTEVQESYAGADWNVRETRINGDVSLMSGFWTHTAQPSLATTHAQNTNGLSVYRLQVNVSGNFTVGPNAKITAQAKGFPNGRGPGLGSYQQGGVSHGGMGNGGAKPYGSAIGPVANGSAGHGSGGTGGGVVRLKVGGKLTVNGPIDADPRSGYSAYAPAGGSVWITAGEIAGAGRISAIGGGGSGGYPPAGGGRISIVLTKTGADFANYNTDLIDVHSGWHGSDYAWNANCAPGTIYLETSAQGPRHGELIVRGYGTQSSNRYTGLCDVDGDCHFSKVTLTNGVRLAIYPGATLVYSNVPMTSASVALVSLYGGGLRLPSATVISNTTVVAASKNSTISFLDGAADKTLTVTNASLYLDQPISLNGSLVIEKGGNLKHETNSSTDTNAMSRLDLTIAGDLTVRTGGLVSGKGGGFASNAGPGKPIGGNYAAAHGGLPSSGVNWATYGSFRRPYTFGSGGRKAGGGIVKLTVAGRTTLNGRIDADASNYNGGGNAAGAGGSIWLTTGSLRGNANIRACGGVAGKPAAGGGRIAVTLTDPGEDFSQFTGRIIAWGAANANTTADDYIGTPVGGNGTVYLRKGGEGELDGTLVLDNNNSTSGWSAYVSPDCTDAYVGNVVFTNKGGLHIGRGTQLTVAKDWMMLAGGVFTNDVVSGETPGGTVVFTNTSAVSKICGNSRFYNLTCLTPNKELQFEANALVTNRVIAGGTLMLMGSDDADGSRVKVRSTVDGTAASLALANGATAAIKYADVQDSDASGGVTIVAEDSIGEDANNINWNFTSIRPGDVIEWTGKGGGTSWADPANWDRERVPVETDVVKIGYYGETPSVWPELAASVSINSLQLAEGALLSLAGSNLSVTNGFECLGTLSVNGSETITVEGGLTVREIVGGTPSLVIAGGTEQNLDLNGQTFGVVTVTKTGGSVAFAGNIICMKFLYTGTSVQAFTFAPGFALAVDEMRISAANGDVSTLMLKGAVEGETWNIHAKNLAIISGIQVRDSVSATPIFADSPSESLGNNVNWNFGSRTASWVGGESGAYDVAENWSDGQVPDAATRLLLDTTATITIGQDQTMSVRELLAQSGTTTLSGKGALSVATTFLMENGSTIVLNVPTTVGQYAEVRKGATLTHVGPHALGITNRVSLTVNGDMVLAGAIDVIGKGWNPGVGLGYKNTHLKSASHGGRGTEGTACYDSISEPVAPGSGGYTSTGSTGGGVVRLSVSGMLTVSGSIRADATSASWGVASGGSVWITAGTLVGAGQITAWGGDYKDGAYGNSGAGGRVSLCQTQATDFSAWTGLASAAGGRPYSAVGDTVPSCAGGTVYYLANGWEKGEVIVDNDGGSYGNGIDLPVTNHTTQALSDYRDFRVIVRNGGQVSVRADLPKQSLSLGDLELETTNSRLMLNGHTLFVSELTTKRRKTWKGIVVEDGGTLAWPRPGLMLFVR